MKKITVNASSTYDIYIGKDLLRVCGEYAREVLSGKKALIVSDDNVAPLYMEKVKESLEKNSFETEEFVFPHGERSKNIKTYEDILNFLAKKRFLRSDCIFALGGGVVGDMAGFCAASYMRGIDFIQLPTSLLADVDSSVGGKTAIDLDCGKNLVGAFYQPKMVICDTGALLTLSDEFFSDGMAEVIKYAVMCDSTLFKSLEEGVEGKLEDIIAACVKIKRDIVNRDEFETGERKLLNFGHTIGHAIELEAKFKVPHGHAVAIGMYIMTLSCERQGICEKGASDRLKKLLKKYNLPYLASFDADTIYSAALSDKKRSGESVSIVIPERIGKCIVKSVKMPQFYEIILRGVNGR